MHKTADYILHLLTCLIYEGETVLLTPDAKPAHNCYKCECCGSQAMAVERLVDHDKWDGIGLASEGYKGQARLAELSPG